MGILARAAVVAIATAALPAFADSVAPYCSYVKGDLCNAITQALDINPELASLRLSVEASEGRLTQASLTPNPTVETTVENFAGSGEQKGVKAAEITATWNQPIELGDKRERREGVARSEKDVAQLTLVVKRAEIIENVKIAYFELLAARERLALSEKRRDVAKASLEAVRRRLTAGSGGAVEESKARLALATSELAIEQARREVAGQGRQLAVLLGKAVGDVTASGELNHPAAPPALESLTESLKQSPDIEKARKESQRRKASVLLEEAKASSDISVSAGLRHARDRGDTGVVVGLSVPVPISDRNQGAIAEARKTLAAADFDERAETVKANAGLQAAHQEMSSAFTSAKKLESDILPEAQRALDTANKAYRNGRLTYLEVLDAQRAFFDAEEELLKSLTTYHTARARAERVLGQGFDNLAEKTR